MMDSIKINCDMGEGANNDHLIMPYIDYANISCGAHAGNPEIIKNTLKLAKKHQVIVGAHPGYPDPENFGRLSMSFSSKDLKSELLKQCLSFVELAKAEQIKVHYIKPHGALYNDIAKNIDLFTDVIEILSEHPELPQKLMILTKPNNKIYQNIATDYNISLIFEGFLDRAYEANGSLRLRSLDGAVHQNIDDIVNQYQHAKQKKMPIFQQDKFLELSDLDTLCIHSDNESSVQALPLLKK